MEREKPDRAVQGQICITDKRCKQRETNHQTHRRQLYRVQATDNRVDESIARTYQKGHRKSREAIKQNSG